MTNIKHKIPQLKERIDRIPNGTFFEYEDKLYLKIEKKDYENAVEIMNGRLVILPAGNLAVYYTDVDVLVGNEWENKYDEEY